MDIRSYDHLCQTGILGILGFWILDLDPGSGPGTLDLALDLGSWTLDLALNLGSWTWTPDSGIS